MNVVEKEWVKWEMKGSSLVFWAQLRLCKLESLHQVNLSEYWFLIFKKTDLFFSDFFVKIKFNINKVKFVVN